jgi:hypothetical protein
MNDFLNNTTGHMILGGLLVLVLSPVFTLLGFPGYLLILLVPLAVSIVKECGDYFGWWPHDKSNFRQAMNDIAEWVFGGVVFGSLIAVTKFLVK